ncbi:Acetylcholinesterase [Strongyloides ratti]|uniref:Acetylcholinesterase n=1 Tax=Strongyloides ratti TaxID=34506 RepID=A0A090L1J9_STRRB|nr:Acetylcholinesterase [Strongyloides ratti]CEF61349.1 Acetylcholinesterase [Strongyloides ratti]
MFIFILILSFFAPVTSISIRVTTRFGTIIGKKNCDSRDVTEFLGVPYALPPVKQLRFKKPEQLTRNYYGKKFIATKKAKACLQPIQKFGFNGLDDWYPKKEDMSEDCLQLNIWVPKNSNGAVIVFLFGGQYTYGSPSLKFYDGSILAKQTGSIVVNVGYRLGVFGFAYFKGEKKKGIPGNLGLLDQQLALKWIQQNIGYFDGDPKQVTLFGQGSGSAMATAHLYSLKSTKLFKRIIASSGTIKNPWAHTKTEYVEDNFRRLISRLKCNDFHWTKEIECMQKLKASMILEKAPYIKHHLQSFSTPAYLPVDEDDVFFKSNIRILFKRNVFTKGKVDILLGKTLDEGSLFMPLRLNNDTYGCKLNFKKSMESSENQCEMDSRNFNKVVELIRFDHKLKEKSVAEILDLYKLEAKEFRDKALRAISDFGFNCDIREFAENLFFNIRGKKYIYTFNKRSSSNPWPKWMGAMHRYDLLYIFGYPFLNPKYYKSNQLKNEKDYSEKLMNVIGGFALNGKMYRELDNLYATFKGKQDYDNKFKLKKIRESYFREDNICIEVKKIEHKYRLVHPSFEDDYYD